MSEELIKKDEIDFFGPTACLLLPDTYGFHLFLSSLVPSLFHESFHSSPLKQAV